MLVIIASAAIPVTDPYLIDRIAAIAALKGCGVLVCLNKTDLDPAEELFDIYSRSAIPVLRVSAETGEGMESLRERIRGKLSVFTGNSGVGKSSILNRLPRRRPAPAPAPSRPPAGWFPPAEICLGRGTAAPAPARASYSALPAALPRPCSAAFPPTRATKRSCQLPSTTCAA